jgi:Uma2 family endonuclease
MPSVKRMTADEFFVWARQPENEDNRFELENGIPVKSDRPGKSMRLRSEQYGFISGLICWAFGEYTVRRKAGYLCKGLSKDLRHAAYVFHDRVVSYNAEKDGEERIQELAVEILEDHDDPHRIRSRIQRYLALGVPLVWFIDPNKLLVEVFQPGKPVKILEVTDTLDGGTALPGFKLPVADLFKLPGTPTQE